MSARALGVIVTGGRHHVVSVEDLAFLERTLRTLGAKEIHTAGSDGVAAQVEAGARLRGIAVRRVTAKWMHDGPANAGERTITLAGVARTVIAFPDEAATVDLLTRARKRRLRIIRKVRADRWLTGRRWIGGSSPCQADRTSGAEFPPNLMNWHRGFNGRIETTAISAGLAPRDYFGDTTHDRPNIVGSKSTLHSAIDHGAGGRGSWQSARFLELPCSTAQGDRASRYETVVGRGSLVLRLADSVCRLVRGDAAESRKGRCRRAA